MRIAFDVKGTLDGHRGVTLRWLLHELKKRGHEVIVWSNSYGFAKDVVEKYDLDCPYESKTALYDVDLKLNPNRLYDLAFDDDSNQTWLCARKFIWVHDIPESSEAIRKLADDIDKGLWTDTKCQENGRLSDYL